MIKSVYAKKRTRKYFSPQNEGIKHKCDHPGCEKEGEFKAPKDKTLKSYYWFCLEHVQEYNTAWNYYQDENGEEQAEEFHKKTHFNRFHSRIRYKFGCDLNEELEFLHGFANFDKIETAIYFTNEDKKNMECLGLSVEEFDLKNLKKQYKKIAKTCHPDLNPDDKEAEEKFKRLTSAYKKLLQKLS